MKICEICDKEITNDQTLWGIQVAKPGGEFEFHYYCSEEHAKVGEPKLGYQTVGEIIDKGG